MKSDIKPLLESAYELFDDVKANRAFYSMCVVLLIEQHLLAFALTFTECKCYCATIPNYCCIDFFLKVLLTLAAGVILLALLFVFEYKLTYEKSYLLLLMIGSNSLTLLAPNAIPALNIFVLYLAFHPAVAHLE